MKAMKGVRVFPDSIQTAMDSAEKSIIAQRAQEVREFFVDIDDPSLHEGLEHYLRNAPTIPDHVHEIDVRRNVSIQSPTDFQEQLLKKERLMNAIVECIRKTRTIIPFSLTETSSPSILPYNLHQKRLMLMRINHLAHEEKRVDVLDGLKTLLDMLLDPQQIKAVENVQTETHGAIQTIES